MRWNCPHCGIRLTIAADQVDQIASSWSYTSCPGCSGNALIRKSEIGVIKIDRVPGGERVVAALTEAPPQPPTSPQPLTPPQPPLPAASASSPQPSRGRRLSSVVSAAIGVAAGATLVSGFFLLDASEAIRHAVRAPAAKSAAAAIAARVTASVASSVASSVAASIPLGPSEISDRVRQSAMAPQRENSPSLAGARTPLLVRAVGDGALFRAGPGLAFPSVGHAEQDVKYVVADWRDRWFRVFLPESDATVWVSSDNVELITR